MPSAECDRGVVEVRDLRKVKTEIVIESGRGRQSEKCSMVIVKI